MAITRRSRSLGRPPLPALTPERNIIDLHRRADAMLIAADDSLLASAEELAAMTDTDLPVALRPTGESTAPFVAAIDAARADLEEACAERLRLDGAADLETQAVTLEQVALLSRSAGARLDAQSRSFDAVRNLERAIASLLPALDAKVILLRERLDEASQLVADLAGRYPSGALETGRAEVRQAGERVDFAEESLAVARKLLRYGDRRGACARVRAAEAALRQASLLLDDLADLPGELSRAAAGVEVLLTQTRRDLAQAHLLATLAPASPAIRFAEAAQEWAASAWNSDRLDPVATRRALLESDAALVRALGDALDPQVALHRAETLAQFCAEAAADSVRNASTAIATRRAVVGAEARLRLSAARRSLQLTTPDDPVHQVEHLQQAELLAEQSLTLVHRDEAEAHDRVTVAGGAVSEQLATAVVGGILVRPTSGRGSHAASRAGARDSAAAVLRLGQMAAVSFGGRATRARRGGAGRF